MIKIPFLSKQLQEFKKLDQEAKRVSDYSELIFKSFNQQKEADNFISYSVFINQFLLNNNYGKSALRWQQVIENRDKHFATHSQIKFRKFTVTWVNDPRFSLNSPVPTVTTKQPEAILNPVNHLIYDFSASLDEKYNVLFTKFNELLETKLKEGYAVEVMPNVIVILNQNKKDLTLL
ncbi:MSC_0623 family F1-like ATPase-associated protein, partial [Mycoplasma nasistruthionis]